MSSKECSSSSGDDERQMVLIAVDGSDQSDHALQFYLKHLHRDNYEVHLLYVADPDLQPILAKQGMAIPREQWEMMVEEFRAKITDMRKKYLAQLEKANLRSSKVRFVHKNGSPGPTIVSTAADEEHSGRCQLIVVGCRGLGTVRRTILGSVSSHVLHHATVPVAVCRGP